MSIFRSIFLVAAVFLLSPSPALARQNYLDQAVYQYYASGAFKARNGDWQGALADYEKAYMLRSNSAEIAVRVSEAHLKTERFAEAEKYARIALDLDTQMPDAWLVLAEVSLSKGNLSDADSFLQKRIDAKPGDLASRLKLGFVREHRNDLAGAVKAYEAFPSRRQGAAAVHFQRGLLLLRLTRLSEARDAFRDVLRIQPGHKEAAEYQALLCEELGEDSAALEAWRNYLKIEPKNHEARLRCVSLLEKMNRYDEAQKEMQSLVSLTRDRTGTLRREQVQIAIRNRDLVVASRTLLDLARAFPSETTYIQAWQLALVTGTETRTAVAALQGAYDVDSRPAVGIQLARLYLIVGREKAAVETLDEIIRRRPGDTDALWLLGLIHTRMGNEDLAEATMLKLVEIDPNHADALNHLAYTWTVKGKNLERAQAFVQRSLEKDSQNPQYLDSLGWIYFQKSEYEPAREWLEKAHGRDPSEPTILEHLGDAYEKLGRKDDARRCYESSLSSGRSENPERVRDKLRELR